MKNEDLAEMFVRGWTSGQGNNMFIEGDTIYSYGHHFPIAKRAGGNRFYYNSQRRSNTTSRHQYHVRNAIAHAGGQMVEMPRETATADRTPRWIDMWGR